MRFQPRAVLTGLLLFGISACDNSASTAATGAKAKATPAASATKDWSTVMTATPEGGFIMGNPDAKVKFLEFASLTCPHCKAFHEDGFATLKAQFIVPGKVSYEYRSFLLNGPDAAAALLARCQGPAVFFNLLNAFYANQESWTLPFTKLTPEDSKRLQALPQDQQIGALAVTGGMDGFMRTRGMPKAKFDQCLSDKAAMDTLTKLRNEAIDKYKLTGTPTFVLNGETQSDIHTWEQLLPKLQTMTK